MYWGTIMRLDPQRLATEYYFGDLQYWKLPRMALDALEEGYDGPALLALAGVANPVATEIKQSLIDSAFREMGVDAPISKDEARLILAVKSVSKALEGSSNIFDEASHIRIHLCELSEPPEALRQIFTLTKEARNAPRSRCDLLEKELTQAFEDFLADQRSRK